MQILKGLLCFWRIILLVMFVFTSHMYSNNIRAGKIPHMHVQQELCDLIASMICCAYPVSECILLTWRIAIHSVYAEY